MFAEQGATERRATRATGCAARPPRAETGAKEAGDGNDAGRDP